MELKRRYLVYLMALFIVVVFLDQNNVPVPVKLIVGPPVQLELSLIVLISMLAGVLLAMAGFLTMKQMRERRRGENGNSSTGQGF
ncbi:MAG: LapA family protein [Nitrospirota bacterium]|nr:LapA family protein [Nitrospirota bacterium]